MKIVHLIEERSQFLFLRIGQVRLVEGKGGKFDGVAAYTREAAKASTNKPTIAMRKDFFIRFTSLCSDK